MDLPDNPCRIARSSIRPLPRRKAVLGRSHTHAVGGGPFSSSSSVDRIFDFQTLHGTVHTRDRSPQGTARTVASFLVVGNVRFDEVSVSRALSDRGDFPFEKVLGDDSGGTMICRGEESLEFRLSPDGRVRRVSFFGLSIPPMPFGPLSVRHFRLDWSLDSRTWETGKGRYAMETINTDGVQGFELSPPIDAAYVWLVCVRNVIWAERFHSNAESGPALAGLDCVGLYHVRMR